MARFDGQTVLVTGAASGIGRASARRFAAEGARVIMVDTSDGVHETASMLGQGDHVALLGDVSAPSVIDAALSHVGARLDVAFANAGIIGGLTPFLDLDIAEWERVLRVNLIGVFVTVQAAARLMVAQGKGAIVCTASVAGLRSGAGGVPYSASKAGVISLVQTVANQLAGSNVRINAVCPGLTQTGMTQPLFDLAEARGTSDKIGHLNPLRRAAAPEEIAEMVLFLASDQASYVNGQAIAVDGGLSSSHPVVPGKMA